MREQTANFLTRPGNRRRFLKLAGGAAALSAGLAALPFGEQPTVYAANDWVITSGFPASGEYLSPVQKATGAFNAIAAYWEVNSGDGNALQVYVRAGFDPAKLGDWQEASSTAFDGKDNKSTKRIIGQMALASGTYAQFKLSIPGGVSVKLVGLNFIDTAAGPNPAPVPSPDAPASKPGIISRASWGANENLRYDGGAEVWPKEYRTAKIVVVHHSETTNTYSSNPAAEVRSIYYYHAVTQGWGDIGYTFLIDWKGNIYEGRAGGDDIVAGHALGFNYGSVGICMIGSFKTVGPTQAQEDALVRLLAWKCSQRDIKPTAITWFQNRNMQSISGHRDVNDTSCPGNVLYSRLPGLRQRIADEIGKVQGTQEAALQSVTFSPTSLKVGETLKVEAVIKNTGTVALETQQPAPGFTYEEGQTYETLNFAKESGRFRFGLDFSDNNGVTNPYRWGLGKTLQPGESATITGYIKLKTPRQVKFMASLVQEYVKYYVEGANPTTITISSGGIIIPPGNGGSRPTDRVASRASDSNITYFSETGHNLGYAFRNYWQQYGGLPIFGFPLTEEFEEESPTEPGKKYIVQYFERNRFEYHPELRGTKYEVLLGLLGVQLTQGRNFPKGSAIPNNSSQFYFPETSHTLRGAFYKYWKTYGGLAVFGYPLSEEFSEKNPDDGKLYTVQYFERNRFEYHAEFAGSRYEVLLGLLGKDLLRRKNWLT